MGSEDVFSRDRDDGCMMFSFCRFVRMQLALFPLTMTAYRKHVSDRLAATGIDTHTDSQTDRAVAASSSHSLLPHRRHHGLLLLALALGLPLPLADLCHLRQGRSAQWTQARLLPGDQALRQMKADSLLLNLLLLLLLSQFSSFGSKTTLSEFCDRLLRNIYAGIHCLQTDRCVFVQ
jgi:hypothetical protein